MKKHRGAPRKGVTGTGGFVGFSSGRKPVGVVDQGIPQEFQLVFKKVSKKDPRTKLKGLAELMQLLGERSRDDVVSVLPVWAGTFSKIAIDNDKRVRVQSNEAMEAVARVVGKELAPHLKKVIGTWCASRFDPSQDVRHAAVRAFQAAFSAEKYAQVLVFCKAELVRYIRRGLALTVEQVKEAETSFSDGEAVERVQRVHSCSLRLLAHLIEKLPLDGHGDFVEEVKRIVGRDNTVEECASSEGAKKEGKQKKKKKGQGASSFWSLSMSAPSLQQKQASYHLVSTMAVHLPGVLEENMIGVTAPLLSQFPGKEALGDKEMWDAILLFVQKFPQCWEHVNTASFFPRLRAFLRHACHGSARYSLQCLFPLFSCVPRLLWKTDLSILLEVMRDAGSMLQVPACPVQPAVLTLAECAAYFTSDTFLGEYDTGDERLRIDAVANSVLVCLSVSLDQEGSRISPAVVEAGMAKFSSSLAKPYSERTSVVLSHVLLKIQEMQKGVIEQDDTGKQHHEEKQAQFKLISGALRGFSRAFQVETVDDFAAVRGHVEAVVETSRLIATGTPTAEAVAMLGSALLLYPRSIGRSVRPKEVSFEGLLRWYANAPQLLHVSTVKEMALLCVTAIESCGDDATAQWSAALETLRSQSVTRVSSMICAVEKVYEEDLQRFAHDSLDELFRVLGSRVIGAVHGEYNAPETNWELVKSRSITRGHLSLLKSLWNARGLVHASALVHVSELLCEHLNGAARADVASGVGSIAAREVKTLCSAAVQALQGDKHEALRYSLMTACLCCCIQCDEDDDHGELLHSFESICMFHAAMPDEKRAAVVHNWLPIALDEVKRTVADANPHRLNMETLRKCMNRIQRCFGAGECRSVLLLHLPVGGDAWRSSRGRVRVGQLVPPNELATIAATREEVHLLGDSNSSVQKEPEPLGTSENVWSDAIGLECFARLLAFASWSVEWLIEHGLGEVESIDDSWKTLIVELLYGHSILTESAVSATNTWSNSFRVVESARETLLSVPVLVSAGCDRLVDTLSRSQEWSELLLAGVSLQRLEKHVEDKAMEGTSCSVAQLVELAACSNVWDRNAARMAEPVISHLLSDNYAPGELVRNVASFEDAWRLHLHVVAAQRAVVGESTTLSTHLVILYERISRWYRNGLGSIASKFLPDLGRSTMRFVQSMMASPIFRPKLPAEVLPSMDNMVTLWLADSNVSLKCAALELWLVRCGLGEASDGVRAICSLIVRHLKGLARSSWVTYTPTGLQFLTVLSKGMRTLTRDRVALSFDDYVGLIDLLRVRHIDTQVNTVKLLVDFSDSFTGESSEDGGDKTHHTAALPTPLVRLMRLTHDERPGHYLTTLDEINELHPQQTYAVMAPFGLVIAKYLAWATAMELFIGMDVNAREELCTYFRERDVLTRFLNDLARDAPLESSLEAFEKSHLTREGFHAVLDQFCAVEPYSLKVFVSWLLLKSLATFPTQARSWWQCTDRHIHNILESFCSRCLSPAIRESELQRVVQSRSHQKYANFDTEVCGNDVTASYEEDEVKLSIVLRLPDSYPLKIIDVGGDKRVGISDSLWRRWLLGMATLLMTRDGSILDALLLWKNSLDRHFEGVDVCPICYSLFHPTSKKLPGMACKTCKNKFHSACLYKWFHTSHKSECPLCRSPFIA